MPVVQRKENRLSVVDARRKLQCTWPTIAHRPQLNILGQSAIQMGEPCRHKCDLSITSLGSDGRPGERERIDRHSGGPSLPKDNLDLVGRLSVLRLQSECKTRSTADGLRRSSPLHLEGKTGLRLVATWSLDDVWGLPRTGCLGLRYTGQQPTR